MCRHSPSLVFSLERTVEALFEDAAVAEAARRDFLKFKLNFSDWTERRRWTAYAVLSPSRLDLLREALADSKPTLQTLNHWSAKMKECCADCLSQVQLSGRHPRAEARECMQQLALCAETQWRASRLVTLLTRHQE